MRKMDYLGASIDVSRNSVLTLEEIKRFIDVLPKMGYNGFTLYNEDLYELREYPMFGYMRGKYSIEELKGLAEYAESKGITPIPTIEVLAHLQHIFRWREFAEVRDNDDILLADEPKTYEFIECMIKTMREIYKNAKYIFLGCDEALKLGLGKYLKKHGYTDPKVILKNHLEKCVAIAHKYGFTPKLSGDMFFSLAGQQYTDNPEIITPEIASMFPKGAIFGYWDYFSHRKTIKNMITACKRFGAPVAFTASVHSWNGFSAPNMRSIASNLESLPVCVEEDIQIINVTFWGDDGGECSVWSCLPAWFFCARTALGETDIEKIKTDFYELFKIKFDDFCKLDYPKDYTGDTARFFSEKTSVFNDPFMGICDDMMVNGEEVRARFEAHANELFELTKTTGEFSYLFDAAAKLCSLQAVKYDLGVRTRAAYKSGDKEALKTVADDYIVAHDRAAKFYESFKHVWLKERKANGFEVQTIRYGGLMRRLLDCHERLLAFINGEIESIPELQEEIKSLKNDSKHVFNEETKYGRIVTVNSLTHYNFYGNG